MKEKLKQIWLGLAMILPIGFIMDCFKHMAYPDNAPVHIGIISFLSGLGLVWVGYLLAGKLLKK